LSHRRAQAADHKTGGPRYSLLTWHQDDIAT